MRLLLPVLGLSFLFSSLSAQEAAKDVYDKLVAAQKDMSAGAKRPDPKDQEAMKAWQEANRAKQQEFQKSAKDTIAANAKLFAEGDGIYYRARVELLARDQDGAAESFKKYIAANPETDLSHEARLMAAQFSKDVNAKKELIAAIKADKLSDSSKKMLEGMQRNLKAEETRTALTGKEPPAIPAMKVLNGNADWSLASLKGKVVVVDFWATWCPPCRGIIPDLVKLQEKHGAAGLQIAGVTRYYGYGMDFAADSELPHGGKSVGDGRDESKKLSEADEVKVNENFVKAFKLNYPVVFSSKEVAGDAYGITGIPTCYVIGRDGKVVGNVVGGGDENHAKLEKMIADALGTGAAEASGKKGAGN